MNNNIQLGGAFKEIFSLIKKRHLKIIDCAPVTMSEKKGFVGISRGLWYRVWFDTEHNSQTLLTTSNKKRALEKFEELKKKYHE